jgi:hypothetical protein
MGSVRAAVAAFCTGAGQEKSDGDGNQGGN